MPQPLPNQGHIDRALTTMSVAYLQSQDVFIAGKVFPTISVDKPSDKYFVYPKGDWFRDEAKPRAPLTESEGSGYTLSQDSFECIPHSFHKDVPDEDYNSFDAPLEPYVDASEFVTRRMLIRKEVDWVNKFFITGIWSTEVTHDGTTILKWDNPLSTPLDDVEAHKLAILRTTGYEPNVGVMSAEVYSKLKNHPVIVDRIKHVTSQAVTLQIMASLMDLQTLYVAKAVVNAGKEGEADSMGFIAGKNFGLFYVPSAPTIRSASAGLSFAWKGLDQAGGSLTAITRERIPLKNGERVEGWYAWDHKRVAADLGAIRLGVVS